MKEKFLAARSMSETESRVIVSRYDQTAKEMYAHISSILVSSKRSGPDGSQML